MLEELRLSGLGVIAEAVLEFDPGFTVVTGETGAGKTMVLTGLGLLLGSRADATLLRSEGTAALAEGRFRIGAMEHPSVRRAVDAGAALDDGVLLVARTVGADGRSRAHVGGRGVPLSLLAELAEDLVAVHGQADQQRLRRAGPQREALDRYGGLVVLGMVERYRTGYARLREVTGTLADLDHRARERRRDLELLRVGLAEIDAAAPEPDEEQALAGEVERLAHADGLRQAAATAHRALAADPSDAGEGTDALARVVAARRLLDPQRAHDPALAGLAVRLDEVGYLLADVAGELASYAASVDADPVRLAVAQERQATLAALARRYGGGGEGGGGEGGGVLAWAARARERLAGLEGDDEKLERLSAEHAELVTELATAAATLSAARADAAVRFATAVGAELAELAMPHAVVQAAVRQRLDPTGLALADGRRVAFGPSGIDEVELLLAPHPGSAARPVAKAASGGELSRVMLAIEAVFAGADPVPTFVFDEVDAGVGGRAAVEVGRRLAELARCAQVIVVTHLPQVAAFADRHLVVTKSDDGLVTASDVRALAGEDRLRELSRMLAGLEDSTLARDHAEELLAVAAAAKTHEVAR